jgi:hypothetical protein
MLDSHLVAPRRLWSANHETGWRVIVDSPIPISALDPMSGPPWDEAQRGPGPPVSGNVCPLWTNTN